MAAVIFWILNVDFFCGYIVCAECCVVGVSELLWERPCGPLIGCVIRWLGELLVMLDMR